MIKRYCVVILMAMISAAGCNEQQVLSDKEKKLVPAAIRIIEESLDSPDPKIRANAIEAVANTRQINLMPKVARLLRDDFVPVRFAAAVAVADMNYRLAFDQVAELLEDTDINVKTAAAYAVGKLGRKQYYQVVKKASMSKDQTVRSNAVWLLGKIADKANLPMLYQIRGEDDDKDERRVKFLATEAIAMLGDETIYPQIWAMLISAYADDRILGVEIMGQLAMAKAADRIVTKADKQVEGALISMLDDDILRVRLVAAGWLGRIGNPIGEPEVLDVFDGKVLTAIDKSDYEEIYMHASIAIGHIGTEKLRSYLPQLMLNDSQIVKIAAAQAVLEPGPEH